MKKLLSLFFGLMFVFSLLSCEALLGEISKVVGGETTTVNLVVKPIYDGTNGRVTVTKNIVVILSDKGIKSNPDLVILKLVAENGSMASFENLEDGNYVVTIFYDTTGEWKGDIKNIPNGLPYEVYDNKSFADEPTSVAIDSKEQRTIDVSFDDDYITGLTNSNDSSSSSSDSSWSDYSYSSESSSASSTPTSYYNTTNSILVDNTWHSGEFENAYHDYIYYTFDVGAGTNYYITWSDSADGDGTDTADVYIMVYNQSGITLLTESDSGYNTGRTFSSTTSETAYIQVRSYQHNPGTFKLKLNVN